jgi:hypothetical protein
MMAGVAGAQFNPGLIIAVLGGIVVVFAVIQLFNPYLLKVEDKTYLDELAARRGEAPGAALSPAEPAEADAYRTP